MKSNLLASTTSLPLLEIRVQQPDRTGGSEEHKDAVAGAEVKFPPGDELSYPEVEPEAVGIPSVLSEPLSAPSLEPPSSHTSQDDSNGADSGADNDTDNR